MDDYTELERIAEGPPLPPMVIQVIVEDTVGKDVFVATFDGWAIVDAVNDAHKRCSFANPTVTHIKVSDAMLRYTPEEA